MEPTQKTSDYNPEFVLIEPSPMSWERYRQIATWHDSMHPIAATNERLEEEWDRVNDLINALAAAEARATAAAAEAGKWQQRHGELQQELAEQEAAKWKLLDELRATKHELKARKRHTSDELD